MCSNSNSRKCSVHVPLHFCYSCTHDCNAVIQTCVVCIHYAEDDDDDDEGDEYYVFSPSKVTAGRNTSSVDIDDADNNDDDDDPEHDYLKLVPSVSSNQK